LEKLLTLKISATFGSLWTSGGLQWRGGRIWAAMIHVLLDVLLAASGLKWRQNIGGRHGDDF
jgi:hypothetical protein